MDAFLDSITSKPLRFVVFILLIGSGAIGSMLYFKADKPEPEINMPKTERIDIDSLDDSFFRVAPIPEPVSETEPAPMPAPAEEVVIEPPKKIEPPKLSELFKFETPKEDLEAKQMKALMSQLNRNQAVQIWYHDDAYMDIYENMPAVKYRKQLESKKEEQQIQWGKRSAWCRDGKCTDSTKPTPLYRTLIRGTDIHAVLSQQIDSEIPSKTVRAEITRDVIAFHGSDILIPKNSIAIGTYEPIDNLAQTRLPIVWDEIITPNGVRIIMVADSSDQTGSEGIPGEVDPRFRDKYMNAMFLAVVTAAVNLSVPTGNESAANAAAALTNAITPIIQEDVQSRLDITPKITIPAGTKIIIKPQAHIFFPEIEGNEVMPERIR